MYKFKSLKDKYILSDFTHRKKDYIFLDLEFNCFTNDDSFHEITSIGAVKCDSNFKYVNCFHSYVTPIGYEKLKDNNEENIFCVLNNNKKAPRKGLSFIKVIEDFSKWLGDDNTDIFVWGTQDTPVLLANLEAANLQNKYTSLLERIKNIQPEISGSIKVLGNPINYSISLENMKKLFSLKKEVTHNGLLDSIDLMNIFRKYKDNADIDQTILCELSYVYRNVDTHLQFNNFKKNTKTKKNNIDIKSRVLMKKPTLPILNNMIKTLSSCNFKFNNEYPKFAIKEDSNELVFDKYNTVSKNHIFNTTVNPCVFEIEDKTINLTFKENEDLEKASIKLNGFLPETKVKLRNEILFSSYIYKNLEIINYDNCDIDFINHFLSNTDMNFSNNIDSISLEDNLLQVKRKKDDNATLISKYNSSFYIKNDDDHYSLNICYKSPHKKVTSQAYFNIPKTENSCRIIDEIINNNTTNKSSQPKLTNINIDAQKLIKKLAKNKGLRTRRKSQLFINDNKLSFLNGRYMEYISLDNASFFISNKERPFIIFKNLQNNKTFEVKVLKNKTTIKDIQELFKVYSKDKPKVTRIYNLNTATCDKLNSLRRLPEFSENNKITYIINNSYIKIRKNINNEYQTETYDINDFKTEINVNNHYNASIHFTSKKDAKTILATCISSKRLSRKDMNIFIDYADKDYNKFEVKYFSEELFNMLSRFNKHNLISYSNNFSSLHIERDCFKFKKKNINTDYVCIEDISIEVVISNNLLFIKLFTPDNIYHYSIDNTEKNQLLLNNLFKLIKKQKTNSWIKVLDINKNLRNSIWRVVENSVNTNEIPLIFDSNHMQAAQKKYFYKNTALSIKKVDSKQMLLQFGTIDSTTYNIPIDECNKLFVDDLIDNGLFYEAN